MPYCRSWAFNIGVKHARGTVLVLHDNDMLVPVDYAANILDQVRNGAEVVNLKRFIFYLSEQHTKDVFTGTAGLMDEAPLSIVQNLEAGGSIAITRQAFGEIGGMDESFVGWGGEDNEFWERAQTRKVWPYACLPLVHLWHAAQPGKLAADSPTLKHYEKLSAIPATIRMENLQQSANGNLSAPAGWSA
jgi:GT2 family glycosyltransferase